MAPPVIALLTDFGLSDHYVGVMKGVMLGICPGAMLVDITHDIAPQDVAAAAGELEACFRFFPPGTVFVCVVDPGVGSSRRAIAAAAGGWTFVGPDNGLLAPVFREHPPSLVVELRNRAYALPQVSRTFEGRDRFGPAAAHLAAGVPLERLGPAVDPASLTSLTVPLPIVDGAELVGEVTRIDRFGNLITNVDRAALEAWAGAVAVTVTVDGGAPVALVGTYADVASSSPCALVGSSGHVEVAVNGGSARDVLGVGRGVVVRLRRST